MPNRTSPQNPIIGNVADEDGIKDKLVEVVENAVKEGASVLLGELHRRAPFMLVEHRRIRAGFERRLSKRWKRAFALLEMVLVSAQETVEDFDRTNRTQAAANNDFVFEALHLLAVRACRTASEVFALLRTGHADGALARWRTLHELAVLAFFIAKNSSDTAERYLLHRFIEKRDAAKEYQLHCLKLNMQPLNAEEFAEVSGIADSLAEKYGPRYWDRYGWAHATVVRADPQFHKKGQVTFGDLERFCELRHFRPHYRFASHKVHAGAQGDYESLGVIRGRRLNLVGASNTGLSDPGQNTCISLVQVITCVLTHSSQDPMGLVAAHALRLLSDEACHEFVDIQREIEEEESRSAS